MSAILSIVYCTKTVFSCFLACQYVFHCVYSGLSVNCFNKDYNHHQQSSHSGNYLWLLLAHINSLAYSVNFQ